MLTRRDATRSLPWQQKQHNTSMSHSITAQRKFSDKIMLNLWACIAHEKCLGTRRKVMHCKISPRSCKINDSKMIQLSSEHQLVDRARFSARIVERLECFVKISCHSTQPLCKFDEIREETTKRDDVIGQGFELAVSPPGDNPALQIALRIWRQRWRNENHQGAKYVCFSEQLSFHLFLCKWRHDAATSSVIFLSLNLEIKGRK